MTRLRHILAVALCTVPLAACGGSEEPAKPAATPAPTAAGLGKTAVLDCVGASDAALDLTARPYAQSDQLELDGVDGSLYETLVVDQAGSIGMQVLVYGSAGDAATSLEQIEANGFFDDVRPAGNAIVIRRGGDAPGTVRVEECAFQA